jgi:hypothetical protein
MRSLTALGRIDRETADIASLTAYQDLIDRALTQACV